MPGLFDIKNEPYMAVFSFMLFLFNFIFPGLINVINKNFGTRFAIPYSLVTFWPILLFITMLLFFFFLTMYLMKGFNMAFFMKNEKGDYEFKQKKFSLMPPVELKYPNLWKLMLYSGFFLILYCIAVLIYNPLIAISTYLLGIFLIIAGINHVKNKVIYFSFWLAEGNFALVVGVFEIILGVSVIIFPLILGFIVLKYVIPNITVRN